MRGIPVGTRTCLSYYGYTKLSRSASSASVQATQHAKHAQRHLQPRQRRRGRGARSRHDGAPYSVITYSAWRRQLNIWARKVGLLHIFDRDPKARQIRATQEEEQEAFDALCIAIALIQQFPRTTTTLPPHHIHLCARYNVTTISADFLLRRLRSIMREVCTHGFDVDAIYGDGATENRAALRVKVNSS